MMGSERETEEAAPPDIRYEYIWKSRGSPFYQANSVSLKECLSILRSYGLWLTPLHSAHNAGAFLSIMKVGLTTSLRRTDP